MVWYNLLWVGWILKGFIFYWDVSPVSSPVTVVNSIKINIVIFSLRFPGLLLFRLYTDQEYQKSVLRVISGSRFPPHK